MKTSEGLDRLELELLRRAREELAPDPAERRALRSLVLASVGVTAGLGAAVGDASAPPPRPSGVRPRPTALPASELGQAKQEAATALVASLGAKFGIKALAGGTLGGVLLGFAAGYLTFGSAMEPAPSLSRPAPPGRAGQEVAAVIIEDAANLDELDAEELGSTDAHAGDARAGDAHAGDAHSGDARDAERAQKPRAAVLAEQGARTGSLEEVTPEAKPVQMSFYEELAYLRRAQAALRRGEPALSLGLMQSLDRMQVDGALLSERAMTKVLSLCLLQRDEEAVQVAHGLIESGGAELYADRLSSSCAHVALSEESGSKRSEGIESVAPRAPVRDAVRERQPGD